MRLTDTCDVKEVLEYLHGKGWTEATPEEIGTVDIGEFQRAIKWDRACAKCLETGEKLCQKTRLVPIICQGTLWGHTRYEVRYGRCPLEREQAANLSPFERLLAKSHLSERQSHQTFEAFDREGLSPQVRRARMAAMGVANGGDWLTLGGVRGVGKSHLAAAIALHVMKRGQQAYFRLVPELLDDLREGFEQGDYSVQMKFLKNVPCLVLDDMGKEHSTEAADDYLYQIIDSRYREGRQVIVTTNARSKEELASWGKASYLAPLVSRMEEMGDFVFITDAEDYRVKMGRARRSEAKPGLKKAS